VKQNPLLEKRLEATEERLCSVAACGPHQLLPVPARELLVEPQDPFPSRTIPFVLKGKSVRTIINAGSRILTILLKDDMDMLRVTLTLNLRSNLS
jgi:hypothetical protein